MNIKNNLIIAKYFSLFISVILVSCAIQKNENKELKKTELYIIGTVHETTNFENSDTLINILNKIKPNVVLIELDSSFFTNKFDFDIQKYPDILRTNENNATYTYKKSHKIDIRPFDISGRNEFYKKTNFFTTQSKMFSEISALYDKGKLNECSKNNFDLIGFTLNLTNGVKYNSLKELNSLPAQKLTELRQKIVYDKTIEIVKSNNSLKKWIKFAELQKDYWIKRNTKMVENINEIAKRYDKKKIVIFVGANHKYFIMNILKTQRKNNFIIKDYFNE